MKLRWLGEVNVNFQDSSSKKKVSETQKYFDETMVLFGSGKYYSFFLIWCEATVLKTQHHFAILADTSILGDTSMLNAGHMEFPFSFTPPRNSPSSFESSLGHVRYLCKATIHRPWAFNVNAKKAFTMVSALDLNGEPKAFVSFTLLFAVFLTRLD